MIKYKTRNKLIRKVSPLESIRSFIAFDIEESQVVRNISNVQSMLVETGAHLKLVKPENVHITVRFLGNISPFQVDEIYNEMKKVDFSPFPVEIKGVGVFPSIRRINVVWAGIRKGADKLQNIFDQLEPKLQKIGLKKERRDFSPHLTIARVRTSHRKAELIRCLKEIEDYEFGIVEARCLRLKRSILKPQGPIYLTLREKCL
ncbi:TPA: RNA 2',3'-cyclic phosphodiesterase [Candidatus Bathyarchaeota archaeon]|nr:RNA 2',3'-cyclic phosphodiesterase [Candidatus Bathyarchaeota archaeon]